MSCTLHAKRQSNFAVDSLKGKSFEYFIDKFESDDLPDKKTWIYGEAYLAKAKAEKNWPHIMNAYKIILHLAPRQKRIFYADSMIFAAKHSQQDELIGSAYLTKGIIYYYLKDHNSALENYLIADEYISGSKNPYLDYKIKYNIAQIKYYLGSYDVAVKLFSECINYFKDEDEIPYLTSMHALGLCYNRMGRFELCTEINNRGISEATRLEYYEAIPRFVNSEGINQYFLKNHQLSLAKLNESLISLIKSKDFSNEAVTYFYLGKNYWDLKEVEKAIPYFIKVDEIFKRHHYTRPDLRENYEILINYYKHKNDLKNQLLYIDQLFLADKFLDNNYQYLTERLHKEYDTKKLQQTKDAIEKSLKLRNLLIYGMSFVILMLIILVGYFYKRSLHNKQKFRDLMLRKNQSPAKIPDKKVKDDNGIDINPEVVAKVEKVLDKFEKTNKFLEKDISLTKLAKMCGSNIVYVSKIITHIKHKKSIHYINDLKIEYIIEELKKQSKFRNYNNKALSEEVGFRTTQHFTRAFLKNAGISPTYFIKELKKEIAEGKME